MNNSKMLKVSPMEVSPTEMELVMNYRAENIAHQAKQTAKFELDAADIALEEALKAKEAAKAAYDKACEQDRNAREALIGMVI